MPAKWEPYDPSKARQAQPYPLGPSRSSFPTLLAFDQHQFAFFSI